MKMLIDYFRLYETCLRVISEQKPEQTQDFLINMNSEEVIKDELAKGTDSKLLISATFETIDNLLDDNLIKGKRINTKQGPVYMFEGLTTIGYQYLKALEKPEFIDKLKEALKEDGIPFSPSEITKLIAKLIF